MVASCNETRSLWIVATAASSSHFSRLHKSNCPSQSSQNHKGVKHKWYDQDVALRNQLVTTAETENQVEGALFLDVVIRESAAILELLSGKDETLLIGRNALLVLNLGLDIVNGVTRLHVERNRLTREGLDENLHSSTETQDEVERRLLLNVVVGESAAILELLSGKDETLLIGGNALLVLNLGLDIVDPAQGKMCVV